MKHSLVSEGFGVRVRPVRLEDAEFIVWLRNQDYVKGRVGDSAADITSQEAWLRKYFEREGDYYFIVETPSGIPLGTHGIYDIRGTSAEKGRHIIRPEVMAGVPAAILVTDLGFNELGLSELRSTCVATNLPVHSLHLKSGFKQVGVARSAQIIDGKPVDLEHFLLTPEDWQKARARLLPLAQYGEKHILEWEQQAQNGKAPPYCWINHADKQANSDTTLLAMTSSAPIVTRSEEYSVERYSPEHKKEWDEFVKTAKNATFLFNRDYMDYHGDRFVDHSLMIFRNHKLAALLPGNLNADGTFISHEGLTYGGLIVARSATLWKVMACFHASLQYLREQRISKMHYKRIPSIYNTLSDDDVAFVLFLLEAHLYRCDPVLAINQAERLRFRKGRKSEISKARRCGVRLTQETDFVPFWDRVLVPRLAAHHGVSPVHTVDEITLLATRFPKNIKQFSAYFDNEIVAGTTIYETPWVAHAQYIGVSDQGRKTGALDYLFGWLIEERYKDKRFFDFGSCYTRDGRTLNLGLMGWKEGFGGRCYSYDFYEIATENYVKLETILNSRLEHP